MPIIQPGLTDVHVDAPLSNIAVAFTQSAEAFVAASVFPIVPVTKNSDKYFEIDRSFWFRTEAEKRSPGTIAESKTHGVTTATYTCNQWAISQDLPDEVASNYDTPLNARREIIENLSLDLLIRREKEWASTYFGASIWTSEVDGVDSASPSAGQFGRWDRADSNPISDVRTGVRTVHQLTGRRPNVMVMGREVYDELLDNAEIVGRLDRGQTSGPAMVMKDALAALFELDEILVMDAIENTAVEGATASYSFIGGKSALLVYRPPAAGIYVPSAGYTFSYTEFGGLTSQVRQIRDEKRRSWWIENTMSFDQKLVSPDLGYFFATAVN